MNMNINLKYLQQFFTINNLIITKGTMESIKRKRRCEIQCKDHIFSIQCLRPNSSKYDIKLPFCPKFQRDPLPPEHIFPQFNNDYKFYTSAFILGVDRRPLAKNEQQEIMDHQKQVRDSLEKHNQLIFPRPNSKHSHCSVCKEHYKNYYLHISSEEHRDRITISAYNFHIKELCKIYLHLWEGSEQRADDDAERLAAQEEERRQKLSEMVVKEDDGEESSLLDVQRGEYEQPIEYHYEDQEEEYQAKPSKKSIKGTSNNDDTVPLRAYKRSAPSARTYQSEYLRKKFQLNNAMSSQRMYRDREQRRYERERQKIKSDRDVHLNNKEFIKMTEKQGDFFIIMKASYAVAQGYGEFIWKRTADRAKKDIEKHIEKTEKAEKVEKEEKEQESPEIERENKKYQIHYDKQDQKQERLEVDKGKDKYDMKPYSYYAYPPYTQDYKTENSFKSPTDAKHMENLPYPPPDSKGALDPYKNPYYYNPYMYSVYDQYPRQKGFDYTSKEKERHKTGEKGYDYPSMPSYQWPYPHPYYAPLQSPPPPNPVEPSNPKASSGSSTNININFPMYMCPPHQNYPASTPRYPSSSHPANPYYEYPIAHNQPNSARQASSHPHHQNPSYPTPQSYPNSHYSSQYSFEKKGAINHNQSYVLPPPPPTPTPSSQPVNHSGYPPYMHHYQPQHYQCLPPQYPPTHPQHQNPPSKF